MKQGSKRAAEAWMVRPPDVTSMVVVIDNSDGRRLPNGGTAFGEAGHNGQVMVRFVVVNDGNNFSGPLTVVGSLWKDGRKVRPCGDPDVVPAHRITLRPYQVWKKEIPVCEEESIARFEARLAIAVDYEEGEEDCVVSKTFQIVPRDTEYSRKKDAYFNTI